MEFNDPVPERAVIRLSNLHEVAHRIRRLGIRDVDVDPSDLDVRFQDHRIRANVTLSIKAWGNDWLGWYWYAVIAFPDSFYAGPMAPRNIGNILFCPYPRHVVRAYQQMTRLERRSPRRKKVRH